MTTVDEAAETAPVKVRPKHLWVGASEVSLGRSNAAKAARRGRVVIPAAVEIVVVEVYCRRCRVTLTRQQQAEEDCILGPQHIAGPRKREEGV